MTAPIKTIIFDFGNVVGYFDYSPALAKFRTLTRLSEPEIRAALEASEVPAAFECGHLSAAEFLEHLVAICQFHADCDRALLSAAWSEIFEPNPAVCDLIPRLKPHYRLLLGSNTNELHSAQFRRQFADILRHFDALVLSHEVRAMKPDHRFFHRCLELAGCEPAECVFIDDLAANVDAARACGLKGIVYHSGVELGEKLVELGIQF